MRKSKTLILGIISGVLCALAVFAFTQTVQNEADLARAEALSRYGGEQVEVCVAQRTISPGEKIDSSNVTTKLWVADLLPDGAIRSFDEVVGKSVTSTVLAGEVLSDQRFEVEETHLEIPQGLSALSVPSKDVQAVGGSLVGGMYVDLYATGNSTNLLAHNVLVITTSIDKDDKGGSVSWVTLAVKPEAVEEVIAASQKMELYFVVPGSEAEEIA